MLSTIKTAENLSEIFVKCHHCFKKKIGTDNRFHINNGVSSIEMLD